MTEGDLDPGLVAEAAVLGACMLSADALAGAVSTLTTDDFDREAHRILFGVFVDLLGAGVPVDTVTVTETLAHVDHLDEVGGAAALHDLTDLRTCPTPGSWEAYARLVAREADRRRTIRELRRAIGRLETGDDPAQVRADLDRPALRLVTAEDTAG